MERKKIVLCIIGFVMILSAIIYLAVYINDKYTDDKNQSQTIIAGGDLVLKCELPTERPSLSSIAVNCPSITTSSEAKNYAIQYFSQFSDIEFEQLDSVTYEGLKNDERVYVFSSGVLYYTKQLDTTFVDIETFPIETASSIAVDFIEDHGGMGQFSEYSRRSIAVLDEDGNPTDEITGHRFQYHRQYNGYDILGADRLDITVDPIGPSIFIYYLGCFPLGSPQTMQQVISASTAWATLLQEAEIKGDLPDVNITSVELCYYINNEQEPTSLMYPVWQFETEHGISFYVNAFTGEYYEHP